MSTQLKIVDINVLATLVNSWKAEKQQVVFTNGCFDILHLGHIDYLEKAKALGNKLVVGINTDDSVKRLKGASRPINAQIARARMLAALTFTDAIVAFNEDTPEALIRKVAPDILVKGNDYEVENIVGADYVLEMGGKVLTIPLIEGYSSSRIISKIINSY